MKDIRTKWAVGACEGWRRERNNTHFHHVSELRAGLVVAIPGLVSVGCQSGIRANDGHHQHEQWARHPGGECTRQGDADGLPCERGYLPRPWHGPQHCGAEHVVMVRRGCLSANDLQEAHALWMCTVYTVVDRCWRSSPHAASRGRGKQLGAVRACRPEHEHGGQISVLQFTVLVFRFTFLKPPEFQHAIPQNRFPSCEIGWRPGSI